MSDQAKPNPFKRNKYRVSPKADRTFDGRVYDSKAECVYAQNLRIAKDNGDFLEVIEQVSVCLGVRENVYRPDFLIVPRRDPGGHFFARVSKPKTERNILFK